MTAPTPTWSDRQRLRERPAGARAMYQNWRELLFVHYTYPPDVVQALLPDGLTVDTHPDQRGRERAWVGVVPFGMEGIRPIGLPGIPGTTAFLETNVRTYVHVDGHAPAVWFFSLEAANALACWAARTFFQLPYHHADMHCVRDGDRFTYSTVRRSDGASLDAVWTVGDEVGEAPPRSLGFFLFERYLLIAQNRRGQFKYGLVHHAPYVTREATVERWEDGLIMAAGLEPGPIAHAAFCEGVDTEIWPIRSTAP